MDSLSSKEDSKLELPRHLSFRDVFFLSFGGMSPLLSLLTYGALTLSYGGPLSPLIMIIGTLIVLVNGFVVMQLSRRFRTSGGYYTYAFQVLSERVGFSTGWVYLFYAMLFGLAYVVGAVYVVTTIFGFPAFLTLLLIVLPASTFLIMGIKPSAKYAIYTGVAEIGVILSIISISFFLTGGSAYVPNPTVYHISGGSLALGILFAMGIPTGYGAIAPISGEVKNAEKVVGRSAISVILTGGLLASFFVYAMSNLLFQKNLTVSQITSALPILSILSNHFSNYSGYIVFAVSIAAINDGVLAILSFGSAASRTIFRMGYDSTFPELFAKKFRGQPINANMAVSLAIIFIPIALLYFLPVYATFIILGTIASIGGLFIHVIAGISLMRVGVRRGRRLILRSSKSLFKFLLNYKEALLGGIAALITSIELVYSAYSSLIVYSTFFLAWIVAGYIIMDIRDIVTRTPYITKLTTGVNSISEKFKDLTSLKVRNALPDVVVNAEDSVKSAVEKCVSLDSPGVAVINQKSIPIGTLILRDVFMLSESEMYNMKVKDLWLERPVLIQRDDDIGDIIKAFKESGMPILSIVDSHGSFLGTVREREVIMSLGGHWRMQGQDES